MSPFDRVVCGEYQTRYLFLLSKFTRTNYWLYIIIVVKLIWVDKTILQSPPTKHFIPTTAICIFPFCHSRVIISPPPKKICLDRSVRVIFIVVPTRFSLVLLILCMSVYNFIIIDYWNIPTWKATSLRVTRAHSRIRAIGHTGYIKFFYGHTLAGRPVNRFLLDNNKRLTPWYIIYILKHISFSFPPLSFTCYFFSVAHRVVYKLWFIIVCVCVCLHVSFVHCTAYRRADGVVSSLYPFFVGVRSFHPFSRYITGCPPL